MASVYPGSLDTLATNKADATTMATDHKNHHNDLADAVNKIEAELGTAPSGSYATVAARLDATVVDVKNFGAAGDGVADDTAEIQAAISALPNGGRIFFPAGTYKLTSTLTLNGHVLEGETVAQSGLANAQTTLQHSFNGDMISFTAGSKGGGVKNFLLNQVGTNTGTCIKAASTAGSVSGYFYFENLIITGGSGWERDVHMDGSANASGIRSVFFHTCDFFGATTAGETVLLNKPVHVYFTACDMSQAPTAIQQGVKITDAGSEDVHWSGKVLGDWSTAAGGSGCWFFGRITGTVTCQSGSANNKFFGAFDGTYTNSGNSGNYRSDATPACRVKKTGTQSLTSATLTAVTFDSEDYDTEVMHDNSTNPSRITIRSAGKYRIFAAVVFAANTAGERAIALKVNNTTYYGGHQGAANTTGADQTVVSASTTANLAAGDYVECYAQQISGGALNIDIASGSVGIPTHFGVERIT